MGKNNNIRLTAHRRSEPDTRKLSRALLTFVIEQAAAEAAAQAQDATRRKGPGEAS
jgi:hypothetical protein